MRGSDRTEPVCQFVHKTLFTLGRCQTDREVPSEMTEGDRHVGKPKRITVINIG